MLDGQEGPLAIAVTCGGQSDCVFAGEDHLDIEVSITNRHSSTIGFPLAFLKSTGPIVRLIDTKTKRETHLRTNPAQHQLKDKLVAIAPKESTGFDWVIFKREIEQFSSPVDLQAEITVMTSIERDGKREDFRGSSILKVVSASNTNTPTRKLASRAGQPYFLVAQS